MGGGQDQVGDEQKILWTDLGSWWRTTRGGQGKIRCAVLRDRGQEAACSLCPTLCLATTQTVEHVCDTSLFQDAHSECVQGFRFSQKKE